MISSLIQKGQIEVLNECESLKDFQALDLLAQGIIWGDPNSENLIILMFNALKELRAKHLKNKAVVLSAEIEMVLDAPIYRLVDAAIDMGYQDAQAGDTSTKLSIDVIEALNDGLAAGVSAGCESLFS
jgi:hypothetical protein